MVSDQAPASSPQPPIFDVLIVSDLHLRGGYDNPTKGLYHFDEEFADFLRYYRLNHRAGRHWQLVIAGDFVEFLYLTDLPTAETPMLRGATFGSNERLYGAGSEASKARWKLDTILRSSHPQLLLALARFVADGNQIVLLRGNHDSELYWPEVQAQLRRLIAEHHPQDVSYMEMKRATEEKVIFAEWFWYVPDTLYVEHGCQYDAFCSFEHFLHPVVPETPTQIEMAISELAIRYFTNQMKLLNGMAAENIKSVSEYIGWVVKANMGILPRVLRLYWGMVANVMAKSGSRTAAADEAVRHEHEKRVAAVDERFALPAGTAAKIDAMHERPVMRKWVAAARFLALDLWVGGFLFGAAALAVVVLLPARLGLLGVLAAFAAVGLMIYVGALRFRRITETNRLHETAARVSDLCRVPYVIFGHSHAAGIWPLPGDASYVNVGTWVPVGEEAFFVYFSLEGEGENRRGRLWRWNKRQQRPEVFELESADDVARAA